MVTANPDGWDGDMRTWEALASGALVLTDPLLTPLPFHTALRHREHLVFYDNADRDSLLSLLRHYLRHPHEAAEIARRGREFVRRHHQPGARMDYIDYVVRAWTDGRPAGTGDIGPSGGYAANVSEAAGEARGEGGMPVEVVAPGIIST